MAMLVSGFLKRNLGIGRGESLWGENATCISMFIGCSSGWECSKLIVDIIFFSHMILQHLYWTVEYLEQDTGLVLLIMV